MIPLKPTFPRWSCRYRLDDASNLRYHDFGIRVQVIPVFAPYFCAERVFEPVNGGMETQRYERLVERQFNNPLLCLYNSGETLRVNMGYCRQIARKLRQVRRAWESFQTIQAPQMTGEASPVPNA